MEEKTHLSEKEKLIIDLKNDYQNLSIFKRIFSWKFIFENIIARLESLTQITNQEKLLELESTLGIKIEKIAYLEKELSSLNENNIFIRESLKNKENEIEDLRNRNEDKISKINNQIQELLQGQKEEILRLNQNHKEEVAQKIREKEALNQELNLIINQENQKYKDYEKSKAIEIQILNDDKNNLKGELEVLRNTYNNNALKSEKNTEVLLKIFQGSTGRQGKIAERILEENLENIFDNENKELWRKNLQIKGGAIVEFAIRTSVNEEKWIPVDSKNLIPEKDEFDKYFIDEKYIKRVATQVNNITKYLNKENTTSYALLVLPADWILEELILNYSDDIKHFINNKRVFISSRSNFIQLAQATMGMQNNLAKAKKIDDVLNQIGIVEKHIGNFIKSVTDGMNRLNKGFDTHLPYINKSVDRLKTISGTNLISSKN